MMNANTYSRIELKRNNAERNHMADITRKTVTLSSSTNKNVYYNGITVLKALSLYHYSRQDMVGTNRNQLIHLRYKHGQQFLIDLFIMTEVCISHLQDIDIKYCRRDITAILNDIPDYRLKYERN